MNWKTVLRLISVDVKSGRLVRGRKVRRFRERRFFQYLLYGGACALGIAVGLLAGTFYDRIPDLETKIILYDGAISLFLSLPTLVLIYSLVFTLMSQIQRAGVKSSIQPPYWMPITWEEHTLASTLANLLGFSLASIISIGSAIAVASVFLKIVPLAIFVIPSLLASAFLASTTTEISRILQVRLVGAVYKSSGKAAVWVRFIGSLIFFVAFYIVWFAFTSGASVAVIGTIVGAQNAVWFVPYVWLGMALAAFTEGLLAHTVIFSLASLLFILILFSLAVGLNSRFGLYEPPAISVSRGAYVPKTGFLGKLGFSSLEAAVIKKDFKAFTRRRELMYIFIMPIVFILMPLMQYFGAIGRSPLTEASPFLFAWILLMPGALMAVMLGNMIVGQEGGSVWYLYSSPITANGLVKCKYTFIIIFSCIVAIVCSIVGILIVYPSLNFAVASFIESLLLIFALGVVSLGAGIRGADFVEVPRPRMIRPLTVLVNMIVCFVLALVMLSPLIPYAVSTVSIIGIPLPLPTVDLYVALPISVIIAIIITYIFYKKAIKDAKEFLAKAEV
jgi:hypothetical protein